MEVSKISYLEERILSLERANSGTQSVHSSVAQLAQVMEKDLESRTMERKRGRDLSPSGEEESPIKVDLSIL